MSTLATFLVGVAVGSVIVGVFLGLWLVDRDDEVFQAGREQGRDELTPWRPVDQVPDWDRRNHPARRRSDRGLSDLTAALGGLLCAVVVLWLAGGVW